MGLKDVVGRKIMDEVVKVRNKKKGFSWRVMIVDKLSTRIVSSCCKLGDISAEYVTIVEDIMKSREPLPHMEAIYFITPSKSSVKRLMEDFSKKNQPMYGAAHVFFTEACPDDLFEQLSKSKASKYIESLKEINVAFIPYESQVFTLDYPEVLQKYYVSSSDTKTTKMMEKIASQVATLCACLGEYPAVRYYSAYNRNAELAELLQAKLDAFKADDSTMGEGPEKARSQLIILDRGFDCVTPVLHELTLQAMANDLLPIDNDVYKVAQRLTNMDSERRNTETNVTIANGSVRYSNQKQGPTKEVILDENDDLWKMFRHLHIADASKNVTTNMKKFIEAHPKLKADKTKMQDISTMIKKLPQYQKELNRYATQLQLAEDCMSFYHGYVDKLCKVEQDLSTGLDIEGEKIKESMRLITPILLDQKIDIDDKIRVILLYILSRKGITQENLTKLTQHAQIKADSMPIFKNIGKLGVSAITDDRHNRPHSTNTITRKEREAPEKVYQTSRWIPVIKDLMEDGIEEKLDHKTFPYLGGRSATKYYRPPASARFGNWHKSPSQLNVRNVPRMIFVIVGGVTYSEMRCAYEVTKTVKNWEVIVGSTHILTPQEFLNNLKEM